MEQDVEKTGNDEKMEENEVKPESSPCVDSGAQDSLQDQFNELNNRFLRLAADFENYRKRTERDMGNRIALANEAFARDMLEISDNFERAMKDENELAREGIEKIRKLFDAILNKHGLTAVRALGARFNPSEHEAIACLPSDKPEGTVIEEVAKGYSLKGKVIRCAKVVVSKGNKEE